MLTNGSILGISNFVADLILFIILLLHCFKSKYANSKVTKCILFFPVGLIAVSRIFEWIYGGYFYDFRYTWYVILIECVEFAAYLFFSLWLKSSPVEVKSVTTMQNGAYAGFNQQNGIIGEADRLRECKELLDAGIITQEEFEAKKKQILKL